MSKKMRYKGGERGETMTEAERAMARALASEARSAIFAFRSMRWTWPGTDRGDALDTVLYEAESALEPFLSAASEAR